MRRGHDEDGAEEGLALDAFLPYRLVVLADTVSRSLSSVYADHFGLSIAEWRIIANLGRLGALSAGVVAERSSLDKPKVTRALQRLLDRALIVRSIEPSDRRQVRISLTRNGQALLRDVTRRALAWEQELLAALSQGERKSLDKLLTRLQHHATALSKR